MKGPIAWVVTGEIFPLKLRAKALSMTTATNWLLNWAIAYSTPYLVNFGPDYANLQAKIFWIWFACCFLCIAFVWFLIYETKGLTLEQIDELYAEVKSARKSIGWVPKTTFREVRASMAQQGGLGGRAGQGGHGVMGEKAYDDTGEVAHSDWGVSGVVWWCEGRCCVWERGTGWRSVLLTSYHEWSLTCTLLDVTCLGYILWYKYWYYRIHNYFLSC